MSFFPLVTFDSISLGEANDCLSRWGHRMGPLVRPMLAPSAHALFHGGRPVAVCTTSCLIGERVGGGLAHLTRGTTVELSRLCAERPGLCRVALRLWREFVFPALPGVASAISYQDADLHTGATYRFDGWRRAAYAHSGDDRRSGRKGRNKWVWVWPPEAAAAPAIELRGAA